MANAWMNMRTGRGGTLESASPDAVDYWNTVARNYYSTGDKGSIMGQRDYESKMRRRRTLEEQSNRSAEADLAVKEALAKIWKQASEGSSAGGNVANSLGQTMVQARIAEQMGLPKPPTDQQYNRQGQLEWIPGSKGELKYKGQMASDKQAIADQQQWSQAFLSDIEKLIGKDGKSLHPGLAGSVGYLDAQSWMPSLSQDQATARALIDAILAKSSVQGLQGIRRSGTAPGSITEREWPIFQNLIGTINPKQDLPSFISHLGNLRTMLQEADLRTRTAYQEKYGTPYEAVQGNRIANIPPEDIQKLVSNPTPEMMIFFDQTYGPGAANQVLR